jgi:hypothetical protein
LANDTWGNAATRDNAHPGFRYPHYQHRNGGRGHIFYSAKEWIGPWVAVGAGLGAAVFGEDSEAAEFVDFMNPASDVQDILFPQLKGFVKYGKDPGVCEPEGAF